MFGLGKKDPVVVEPSRVKPECIHAYRRVKDTGPWDIRVCGRCRHALVKIAGEVIERAAAEYAAEMARDFWGPTLEVVAEVKPRKGAKKRR